MKNKRKRGNYRKHLVRVDGVFIPVKDWMRDNGNHFTHIHGVPTSFQIGTVLVNLGYTKIEENNFVMYS